MRKYRLSQQARHDIDAIWDYIAQDNPTAATQFLGKLADKLTILAHQPRAGRRCDELGHDILRFPIGTYIIFYRIVAQYLEVARILHGARDIEALFRVEEE